MSDSRREQVSTYVYLMKNRIRYLYKDKRTNLSCFLKGMAGYVLQNTDKGTGYAVVLLGVLEQQRTFCFLVSSLIRCLSCFVIILLPFVSLIKSDKRLQLLVETVLLPPLVFLKDSLPLSSSDVHTRKCGVSTQAIWKLRSSKY